MRAGIAIANAEDLAALRSGAVVLDHEGTAWQRNDVGYWISGEGAYNDEDLARYGKRLTVLHVPPRTTTVTLPEPQITTLSASQGGHDVYTWSVPGDTAASVEVDTSDATLTIVAPHVSDVDVARGMAGALVAACELVESLEGKPSTVPAPAVDEPAPSRSATQPRPHVGHEFELTAQHVALLRAAIINWGDGDVGAPRINPDRPYGGVDVWHDIARIVEPDLFLAYDTPQWDRWVDENRDQLRIWHEETRTALQVILATGQATPGWYARTNPFRTDWEPGTTLRDFTPYGVSVDRFPGQHPGTGATVRGGEIRVGGDPAATAKVAARFDALTLQADLKSLLGAISRHSVLITPDGRHVPVALGGVDQTEQGIKFNGVLPGLTVQTEEGQPT